MKRVLFVLQELIKCFLIFAIIYIWTKYSLDSKAFAVAISIALALFIELILLLISRKRHYQKTLKISEKEDAEKMFMSLVSQPNYLEFFFDLFKSRHKNIKIKENYLIITNFDNEKVLFFPFLKIQNLNIDDLIEITRLENSLNKIIISCNAYNPEINTYLANFESEISVLDKYETYALLYKEYEFFPKINSKEKIKKNTFKSFVTQAFSKSKTNKYIFAGIIIALSYIYVPFSLYYKIAASIFFIFALICFLKPSQITNKKLL